MRGASDIGIRNRCPEKLSTIRSARLTTTWIPSTLAVSRPLFMRRCPSIAVAPRKRGG